MRKPLEWIFGLSVTCLFIVTLSMVRAADDGAGPDAKEVKAVLDKAAGYLKKKQAPDGSFPVRGTGPGVTALAAAAFLSNGYSIDDPVVEKALAALEKSIQKDGGIYDKALANYTTSVALMTFVEANKGGKYDAIIKNATKFLKGLQQIESGDDDVKFGGVGYDGSSRPDLSNTQLFIDALIAAGVPKDDPAIQKALKFVNRCQNLPGETNDQAFAKKTSPDDKGGLTYNPIDPDQSNYKTADGGLRSLGGMTYAGLKSFLYAGVSKDDPRVKAALNWILKHYTLEENPGMGQAGLYYYYHTFGKAMAALGEDQFEDADGKKHDWRRELFVALKKRQREDGSWINETDKQFGEASPELATAFAMLSLSYCQPPKRK
ncbi:MAG TPA: prenyltransferase/squalene oxidase repeat-containing protein [Gemmataceae bacterium]|jgi:squalene-hopene/tetraprenyl-beta-curcumene cyclase